ncbi:Right handed beta helix region [Formosa sp. Hel1_31_208]|uniref:right-handed parallel beta-helix repeat-containing protein n=1 Tax=Formosa sp. Hel1_31_208 TaxID=1798225 RepID=UPI0008797E13|nr:right-handed parallel beta-helix repeat-containing protein [Formosa sp. Hel1_31_208]SDR75155.1 Right handed beta helix region [Formosa sp. Hel1_31_208]
MMLKSLIKNHLLKVVILVPLLLLVVAFLLKSDFQSEAKEANKYYKTLPSKYVDVITDTSKNDPIFFCSIRKDKGLRELVIMKTFPTKFQEKVDFSIQLFPKDKKLAPKDKGFITQLLVNDATLYNYNGKTYGVFRTALPLINVDKIVIKEKGVNKKQKTWEKTIKQPFEIPTDIDLKTWIVNGNQSKQPTNPYSDVFTKVLESNDISTLPNTFSIVNDSLYKDKVDLNEYAKSKNLTIGIIKDPNGFWNHINSKDKELISDIQLIGDDQNEAKLLLSRFIDGEENLDGLFALDKLSKFLALEQLFSQRCSQDFHVKYNKDTNLLEPFYVEFKCLGSMSKYVSKPKIKDFGFLATYIEALREISELDLSEYIKTIRPEMDDYLIVHNSFYPQSIFDIDILEINQRIIRKSLNQNSLIKSELLSFKKDELVVTIENLSNYPIFIKELSHNTKKNITAIDGPKQLLGGSKDTLKIRLPRSFENLFVSKKKKIAEFILYKHINELFLGYSIIGMNDIAYTNIIPYQEKEVVAEDLFRKEVMLENDKNIKVDKQKNIISFSKKKVTIDYPLIIPSGYIFKPQPGTQIDVVRGGKMISYSPLMFLGNKKEDIKVFSSDKKGQGLIVFSDGTESQLTYVKFLDLTNPKHGNWNVTGAVTFYESPVEMNNVIIENNRCEDALNIVRTTFRMRYCRISNTQSDAFDGDFVKGNIVDCNFDNLGNDAIDVSGSDLKIIRVNIEKAGDKGLSAGEDSKMMVENVQISNSEIAIAGKDLSTVTIKNLKVTDTKLGFTAFQKKPEFGPSNITANEIVMNGVETKYLIESSSSLIVDGKKIETAQNVKDRMYGVEFGRSSAETRNSQ